MSNLGKLELLMQEQIPQVRGPAPMNTLIDTIEIANAVPGLANNCRKPRLIRDGDADRRSGIENRDFKFPRGYSFAMIANSLWYESTS
jgi:hypothetical protein